MKKLLLVSATLVAPAAPAFAIATPVPEISAIEGVAAVAALAAVVLLAWERRRRSD